MFFHYWKDGKKIAFIDAETLTAADDIFMEKHKLDPQKNGITVTIPKLVCTAKGTMDFWRVLHNIPNFSGFGVYETTDGWIAVIKKAGKVPKPTNLSGKEDESVHKYGYGQMFFGSFWGYVQPFLSKK